MKLLHIYRFSPDPTRSGEFSSSLWQGPVPEDFRLDRWLYVESDPRQMLLICECEEPGRAWIERKFGSFGTLTGETITESTPGLAACLDRDLDGFGTWLRARGSGEEEIVRQLDVRRRGLFAGTHEEAVGAGRAWSEDQQSGA